MKKRRKMRNEEIQMTFNKYYYHYQIKEKIWVGHLGGMGDENCA